MKWTDSEAAHQIDKNQIIVLKSSRVLLPGKAENFIGFTRVWEPTSHSILVGEIYCQRILVTSEMPSRDNRTRCLVSSIFNDFDGWLNLKVETPPTIKN